MLANTRRHTKPIITGRHAMPTPHAMPTQSHLGGIHFPPRKNDATLTAESRRALIVDALTRAGDRGIAASRSAPLTLQLLLPILGLLGFFAVLVLIVSVIEQQQHHRASGVQHRRQRSGDSSPRYAEPTRRNLARPASSWSAGLDLLSSETPSTSIDPSPSWVPPYDIVTLRPHSNSITCDNV